MKKILAMLMVCVMMLSLGAVAFADESHVLPSAQVRPVDDVDIPEGCCITSITTNAKEDVDVKVEILTDDDPRVQANIKLAEEESAKVDTDVSGVLASFSIDVSKDGVPLPEGEVEVTVGMQIPQEYVGCYLNIVRTVQNPDGSYSTVIEQSILITGTNMTFTLMRFGVFTVLITRAKLPVGVSPQTGDNYLAAILVTVSLLAIGGAIYARKRRYN